MLENPDIPEAKIKDIPETDIGKILEQLIQGVPELSSCLSREERGPQDLAKTTLSIIEGQAAAFHKYADLRGSVNEDYLGRVASALGLPTATASTGLVDNIRGLKNAQKAGEVAKRLEALRDTYTQNPEDAQALKNFLEVRAGHLVHELQRKIEELTENPDYNRSSKLLGECKTAIPLLEKENLTLLIGVIRKHAENEGDKLRSMLLMPSNIINELKRIELAIGYVQRYAT